MLHLNLRAGTDLFEEFCDEFTREVNRLQMEHRDALSSAARQLERVRAGIRNEHNENGVFSRDR
jgi:ribosomal protein L44E